MVSQLGADAEASPLATSAAAAPQAAAHAPVVLDEPNPCKARIRSPTAADAETNDCYFHL